MSNCASTSQRSHRRTSVRIPTPRHQHPHHSPPPSPKQGRVTLRSTWPKHVKPESEPGPYTLTRPTLDHRDREIRSDIWQPDLEEEYMALCSQRIHEQVPRRPRARTVVSAQEVHVRSGRSRVRSGSLSSSPLDHPQLHQTCPAIVAATRTELSPTSRKRDPRRKHSMHHRPSGFVRRDSGYESGDADIETSNEENTHHEQARRHDSAIHMSQSRGPPNVPTRAAPFGPAFVSLDARSPLPRPDSPSNESSASTDDDNAPASFNPHALEYYLGTNDAWRETEIFSATSEESGLSDDNGVIARHFDDTQHPDESLTTGSRTQSYPRRQYRSHRAPHMPKRVPLVPTCSSSRKRASMRAAWKMRFGRLFESDSEAGTEVDDELDWEGYESADARRIVAMRILRAGGGDGRKMMKGTDRLSELLVKQPMDPRRLAARVPCRNRTNTIRGHERADTIAVVQPDTCIVCAAPVLSPSLSTKSVMTLTADSPTSTSSASLVTPISTPPTSVPNTPCPTCAQLSPRGDILQLSLSSPTRRRALGPRSPPCKTTPLDSGTDPLTMFAVAVEMEKQRDFSGLLKRSAPPSESTFSSVSSGLIRSVKSFFVKLNNFVDFAANAPLPTGIDGTCPLSPVMGTSGSIARDISGSRRRAASVPELSPVPRSRSQRRRSYVRAPTQPVNPGAPTSPYGYRVRPQEVTAAFPALDERMGNVAPTPVPTESTPSTLELRAMLTRPVDVDALDGVPLDQMPIVPIDLKGPPSNNAEARRRRESRSPSKRRTPSTKRSSTERSNSGLEHERLLRSEVLERNRDEISRSRAVVDSKYWRVLAGEMEQRRRGGIEVTFMVRLAVEEGRNLPIFTSEERQAATGEIVVGGVWKASLARWRVGGVGKGPTRIPSGLANEAYSHIGASDTVSDASSLH